ncbi:MAG: HAD-IIB family hydrolase [Alphaproteobacteria bacterium]
MSAELSGRSLIIVTDLDGTLLDQQTYSYEASLPAIGRLQQRRIPIVFCSSKTAAEIISLQRELGLSEPFICESGGAIYLPPNYFPFEVTSAKRMRAFDAIEFGKNVDDLRRALGQAAQRCGVDAKSFGSMSFQEIMARTGLNANQARDAAQREYDEPFLIESDGGEAMLVATLAAMGLTVTRGDRFYHVTSGHDKGKAVRELLSLYRQKNASLLSVGLGNSANDLPLLRETDIAVLVRNPDGHWDVEVIERLPNVERSNAIGAQGWCEAVDRIMSRFAA